jgi:excisionase family DNA binding protein
VRFLRRHLRTFDVYSRLVSTLQQRLRQALEAHRKALEELESTLLEFEGTLGVEEGTQRPQEGQGGGSLDLLSIPEVCKALGMGKSWTYRRLKSGEIPSVKLGRTIKVKREDLEEYLESRRYQLDEEE